MDNFNINLFLEKNIERVRWFIVKIADHDENHWCLVEKNVPIALILPTRWQDAAESLGMETSSVYGFAHLKKT